MPVSPVNATPIGIQKYDVLASTRKNYVRHVGLALQAKYITDGESVLVGDMAPPMRAGADGELFAPHIIGHSVLTYPAVDVDEYRRIEEFLDEAKGKFETHRAPAEFPLELKWFQYVVHPHYGEGDKDHPGGRYSCAGFVFEAYRSADVTLFNVDSLPSISYAEILKAYPEFERAGEDLRKWIGLAGTGPWPVMMPGYLMASLNRSGDEIRQTPYTPNTGDMAFPPSPSSAASASP